MSSNNLKYNKAIISGALKPAWFFLQEKHIIRICIEKHQCKSKEMKEAHTCDSLPKITIFPMWHIN